MEPSRVEGNDREIWDAGMSGMLVVLFNARRC